MILKLFRAGWFFSVLVVLIALLYVYASLPAVVVIQQQGAAQVSIDREIFFYGLLIVIAFINVMVFIVAKVFKQNEKFRSWFCGQIITLNIFFVIAMSFISLLNSNESYDYSRIGFVIYGSVGLVVVWALSWPVMQLFSLIKAKQSI